MRNIHIGLAIQQKLQERGMRISDFARAIHCNRTNVYSIFTRKSIDIDQLLLISKVLEHDFIAELYSGVSIHKKYIVVLEVDEQQLQELSSKSYVKYVKEV